LLKGEKWNFGDYNINYIHLYSQFIDIFCWLLQSFRRVSWLVCTS